MDHRSIPPPDLLLLAAQTTDMVAWLTAPPVERCYRCRQDRTATAPLAPCPHCGADCTPF
jgi:hypothetical protein